MSSLKSQIKKAINEGGLYRVLHIWPIEKDVLQDGQVVLRLSIIAKKGPKGIKKKAVDNMG